MHSEIYQTRIQPGMDMVAFRLDITLHSTKNKYKNSYPFVYMKNLNTYNLLPANPEYVLLLYLAVYTLNTKKPRPCRGYMQ